MIGYNYCYLKRKTNGEMTNGERIKIKLICYENMVNVYFELKQCP